MMCEENGSGFRIAFLGQDVAIPANVVLGAEVVDARLYVYHMF